MILIRKSVESDILALKDRLRKADEEEIIAAGNESVESGLAQSLANALEAYTVELGGLVVAIFGLNPDTLCGASACIWFLGTKEMGLIKKSFVRKSKEIISHWLTKYNILWNVVDGRYINTINWLCHCGAVFQKQPVISNGVPFYLFSIERK